jgi:hypothetical protein
MAQVLELTQKAGNSGPLNSLIEKLFSSAKIRTLQFGNKYIEKQFIEN